MKKIIFLLTIGLNTVPQYYQNPELLPDLQFPRLFVCRDIELKFVPRNHGCNVSHQDRL